MRFIPTLLLSLVLLLSVTGCESVSDSLVWKNDRGSDKTGENRAEQRKEDEVTPYSLEKNRVNPISEEQVRASAMTRPKVVRIDDMGGGTVRGGKKHFDVVDARTAKTGGVVDTSARAVRAITYDNNAVAKEFALGFDIIWERTVEAMLTTPLATVDRSSGIITTAWLYDQRKNKSLTSAFLSGAARLRYKYTIRVLDLGYSTQIMVIPFINVLAGPGGWTEAKPSIAVTDRFFERLEKELMLPIARP